MAWRWLWHRDRKNFVHHILISGLFIRLCGNVKLNNSSGNLYADPEFKGYKWLNSHELSGSQVQLCARMFFLVPHVSASPFHNVLCVFPVTPLQSSPSIYIFWISLSFILLISKKFFFRHVILVLLKVKDRSLLFHLTPWSKDLFEKILG